MADDEDDKDDENDERGERGERGKSSRNGMRPGHGREKACHASARLGRQVANKIGANSVLLISAQVSACLA